MTKPPTIRPFSLRHKAPNYLQGFYINLFRDILKKLSRPSFKVISRKSFKGRFSFKLRWEHVIIAFLLGALLLRGGTGRIVKHVEPSGTAPAIIQLKTLPKLKDVSYVAQTPVEPMWVDKRRPIGTYANDYAWGNCTEYVASRLPIPNSMGNASNWAYAASLAGYTVSAVPQVGSIAQTGGDSYLGHVAIVESINPDGSFVVSEMNYLGLGVVDSRTTTTAEFSNFIYV